MIEIMAAWALIAISATNEGHPEKCRTENVHLLIFLSGIFLSEYISGSCAAAAGACRQPFAGRRRE